MVFCRIDDMSKIIHSECGSETKYNSGPFTVKPGVLYPKCNLHIPMKLGFEQGLLYTEKD